MDSITEIFTDGKQLIDSIGRFFDRYVSPAMLRRCNITKIVDSVSKNGLRSIHDNPIIRLIGECPEESKYIENCVSARKILFDKIILGFSNMSAFRMFKTNTYISDYKKDTFYRFDNLESANWERLQLETAASVIADIEEDSESEHVNALLFDDTLYARTGGKGTDLCARVFDHAAHAQRIGFRMMTGSWTNSEIQIPFAQTLLTTRDENLMVGNDAPVDGRTVRGKRRQRAKQKGTDCVAEMVCSAKSAGIPFDYVLFDTWFSSPAQLVQLKGLGTDIIAMIKKNSTKYTWEDPDTGESHRLNVKEIYSRNRKRPGLSKYLLSVDVIVSDSDGNEIPARLVYARNRNNRKDWVCFVCTDMSLGEEEILRLYTLRWQLEVYFKMSKSYLKLRTECHSTSYDAITSHMVVVALRYMMLALERYNNTDRRTMEDLFFCVQREVVSQMMDCAVTLIIDALLDSVREYFGATDRQITELVVLFIGKLPEEWKRRFDTSALA